MAGLYDLMLLIDPNAPEERRTAAISEAESLIDSGGSLAAATTGASAAWPTRSTTGPRPSTASISSRATTRSSTGSNQRLRILDGVLRFRIIKAKPGAPVPPPPEHQAIRRRDDREPQDTRVAARAAADAPPAGADIPPAEPAAADAPPLDTPADAVARRRLPRPTPTSADRPSAPADDAPPAGAPPPATPPGDE